MRTILLNLIQLGGMQIVIALTAIARNKVLAVRLGTEGFGEFIQLTLIVISASVIVAFGLGMSLNRNAAAADSDEERQRLLSQANGINVLLSAVILLVGVPLVLLHPGVLTWFGLQPTRSAQIGLIVLGLYIPMQAAMQHRISFLTAILDIKGMAGGRSLALIIGTVVTIPVVWYFGMIGAAVQLTLLTVTNVLLLDRRCRQVGYRPWGVLLDWTVARVLAALGVASLLAGFAQRFADLYVRSALIRELDASENGIYQAALSITYQVRAIVLGSVGSYMVATLSQNRAREVVIETANRLLSVVLPIAAVAFGALGLLSGPAILILYSPDFLPAQSLLPFLLATDYLNVLIWVVGAPLLAMNRVGVWLTFELILATSRTVAAVTLLPHLGAVGVALGYGVGTTLHLLLTGGFYVTRLHLTVSRRSIVLFLTGGVLAVGMAYVGSLVVMDFRVYGIGAAVLAAFGIVCLHHVVGLPAAWASVRRTMQRRQGAS